MADESPVGSPLSTISSDAFEAEYGTVAANMPPAKRQKLEDSSMRATPTSHQIDFDAVNESSDTEGEVPNSPGNLGRPEDDDSQEQVTVCAWDGCDAGDLENMDRLVDHIHNEHIETRQKKYTCEWGDCNRKSMAHASGYALKAHMRSHTREKPFYCALPECDRAFTRSDALAKHMRTVHETEALRPSDPIPKSMQPAKSSRKLKLNLKVAQSQLEEPQTEQANGVTNGETASEWTSSYPPELGFTAEEEANGPEELYRYLRRQLRWAEEDLEKTKRLCDEMEALRRKEWEEKEILLDQVIKNEIGYHERRAAVLASASIPTAEEIRASAAAAVISQENLNKMEDSDTTGGRNSLGGGGSFQSIQDRNTETAAILASMSRQA
ncbi:hypothetical protein HYFRA_00002406 [Hymenoscyphus fraxineus]|uniref:C2H2-type domain-containing protein n=1 Tax=Hymenoscyphus fraxineus TaxID=746836 RepID=A0A9N9L7G4_9HELO|nr:hypothetical protein HYFRA_00002406 [Hymenoscyphus fraxineus]